MLVYVPGVHGVPAVEFGHRPKMHKPVHLYGLPKVPGGMGRHPSAHGSNLFKLRLAHGVLAGSGHLRGQGGMPFGKEDGGVTGD